MKVTRSIRVMVCADVSIWDKNEKAVVYFFENSFEEELQNQEPNKAVQKAVAVENQIKQIELNRGRCYSNSILDPTPDFVWRAVVFEEQLHKNGQHANAIEPTESNADTSSQPYNSGSTGVAEHN